MHEFTEEWARHVEEAEHSKMPKHELSTAKGEICV